MSTSENTIYLEAKLADFEKSGIGGRERILQELRDNGFETEAEDIEESVCEFCLGTGEVSTMEQVYAGEPHMADIGTAICSCQVKEEDGDVAWKERDN